MPPTFSNGKICYIQIPATNIARSADFYSQAFGWKMRARSDGSAAFDDGVGEVSGTFVLNLPPSTAPGLLIYIMVDDAIETITKITAAGGASPSPSAATPARSPPASATRAATSSAFTAVLQNKSAHPSANHRCYSFPRLHPVISSHG